MQADGVPPSGSWDEAIGPFLDVRGVRARLGNASEAAVLEAVARDELLALPGEQLLFPAFQLRDAPTGLPQLPAVLTVLRDAFESPWSQADWLNSPVPAWAGATPASELAAGRHERVLALARRDTQRRQ